MGKAVLVMDMPDSCAKCQFVEHEDEGWLGCSICDYRMAYVYERADYCPLKLLPEKKERQNVENNYDGGYSHGYTHGFNACLDEIGG